MPIDSFYYLKELVLLRDNVREDLNKIADKPVPPIGARFIYANGSAVELKEAPYDWVKVREKDSYYAR
jgi:hypothetical protein